MSVSAVDPIARAKEIAVPPPAGSPYSVALPGSETEGRSKVYRHWRFKDQLLRSLDPSITTAHEMFDFTANRYPSQKCLGHRPYDTNTGTFGPYQWQDYQTIQRRKADFGVGLVHLHKEAGVTEQKYGVGLWCQNRPEWQITDLACMSQSLFSVSIYDTLGPGTTEYIINHATLKCVVTSISHITTLLKIKPRLPTLKFIISLDPLSAGELPGQSKKDLLESLASDVGVRIYYIGDVEAIGRSNPRPPTPPSPEDIITINYTSGTTGNPKGVVLSHANAVAAASTSQCTILHQRADVICSYLPLAHIYERMAEHSALWAGSQIGFFHGNILELVDDLKLLRPSIFLSVPRLYNRFGSAIRSATLDQGGVKGAMSKHIVSTKLATINGPTPSNKHVIYDRVWGRKISAALGLDRTRGMVSGSAPLDPSLHQFLRVVFANHFIQGYGLTETYAISLSQQVGDLSSGNCGAMAPTMEGCLLDVPDMEYMSTDKPNPRGELLLRGSNLFREYYRNEAETKKAMLPGGWFRTGDICSVDSLGRFTIIDRVKNVLKLAQGEYISPERIENVYLSSCPWMGQAYVHGDSVQTFLVAVFGINPDTFAIFASKILGKPIKADDRAALTAAAEDPRVKKAVLENLDKVGRKSKFNSWERVRNCVLYLDPFTIENDLLTPTLKLKRPQTAKMYRADLDRLYEEALKEEQASDKPKARL
ncbi:MAG: hypothetical protein M1837_001311 [Sclerophora amabilis]|nr:MAG: hypothetical protein M1837_001311 [Sclerophora amabilis]